MERILKGFLREKLKLVVLRVVKVSWDRYLVPEKKASGINVGQGTCPCVPRKLSAGEQLTDDKQNAGHLLLWNWAICASTILLTGFL